MVTCIYERRAEKALISINRTLNGQSEAMINMVEQYKSPGFSQVHLANSLEILYQTVIRGGKVVISGIGKSYKISTKLVATLNSLSIQSTVLHPAEGLHGDLGILRDNDTIIFVTASGNTPELLQLLPHISLSIPIILLTCTKTSKLSVHPQIKSLLYAELPPHLNEVAIHGLPAPTVSATLSLVLADATILALSEMIEEDASRRKILFSMKHPGGSIGAEFGHLNDNFQKLTANDTLRNNNSLSLQTSSSSLLSLNQLRKSFDHMPDEVSGTSASEDDRLAEMKTIHKDFSLQNLVNYSSPTKVLTISDNQLKSAEYMNESRLLKWTVLYDFIVSKNQDGSHSAVDCENIKELFRSEHGDNKSDDDAWRIFHGKLMDGFKDVELTH